MLHIYFTHAVSIYITPITALMRSEAISTESACWTYTRHHILHIYIMAVIYTCLNTLCVRSVTTEQWLTI